MRKIIESIAPKLLAVLYYIKKEVLIKKDERKQNYNRKLLLSQFVKKNDLVFDVGANMGNRVASLLGIKAKVVAFEPQQECATYLKRRFGEKIVVVEKGLGAEETTKEFFISNANTLSSFSTEWINSVKAHRFQEYNWDTKVVIPMSTLDKQIDKYGIPVFIKIDVEGYEFEVLQGLSYPIKMISFEYTVPEQIEKALNCINQIEMYNTNIECNYIIGENNLFALNQWCNTVDIKRLIKTEEFIMTGFGDIYIRTRP